MSGGQQAGQREWPDGIDPATYMRLGSREHRAPLPRLQRARPGGDLTSERQDRGRL